LTLISLCSPTDPLTGDSKSTVDKLSGTATSVGQNIHGTAQHYADKSEADKAGAKAESVGQNILDTGKHYSDKSGATEAGDKLASAGQNVKETAEHEINKANQSTGLGQQTYLDQAQNLAASALNTASKAASGKSRHLSILLMILIVLQTPQTTSQVLHLARRSRLSS
jgi:hypothetical protein